MMRGETSFEQLWQVDREIRRWFLPEDAGPFARTLFGSGLEAIGLLVGEPPSWLDAWWSPLNSLHFAEASGDGRGYSVLTLDDRDLADCPVLLSSPGSMETHTIVGGDLHEFLCLGCRSGYDVIPNCATECLYEMTLADTACSPDQDWLYPYAEHRRQVLFFLVEQLHLEPWRDIPTRLKELDDEYRPAIKWNPPHP